MAKSKYSATDLIIAMSKLGDKLGHPPTISEVDKESKMHHMASVSTYLHHLGGKDHSWGAVLEACGFRAPQRAGRGHTLSPEEKARRAKAEHEKREQREAKAREKRIAKFQADKAKETAKQAKEKAEQAAKEAYDKAYNQALQQSQPESKQPQPAAAEQPTRALTGRTQMADELALINLTGMPVKLRRRKRDEVLPSLGTIMFFAESYKFLDDTVIDQEIKELFGSVQTKKVHMPFYLVNAKSGERRNFPKPKPGTYYLLPRKHAELIASTGRTMNDLLFPLQYRTERGILIIEAVGIKPSSKSQI